jgi:hypothetical protein
MITELSQHHFLTNMSENGESCSLVKPQPHKSRRSIRKYQASDPNHKCRKTKSDAKYIAWQKAPGLKRGYIVRVRRWYQRGHVLPRPHVA